jgi:hypothetical protein
VFRFRVDGEVDLGLLLAVMAVVLGVVGIVLTLVLK